MFSDLSCPYFLSGARIKGCLYVPGIWDACSSLCRMTYQQLSFVKCGHASDGVVSMLSAALQIYLQQ